MEKGELLDKALEMLMGDMDDMEGSAAMAHSADDCPDPLGCTEHDGELGKNMTPDGGAPSVKIEVSKGGLPSLDGVKAPDEEGKSEEGLSPEEAEALKKLLK